MEKLISKEISAKDAGRRLGDYLKTEMELTKAQIRRLKYQENALRVNGCQERVTCLLKEGDLLEVLIKNSRDAEEKLVPVEGDLDILYEDEDVICIWKPAGIVVHPVGCHKEDSISNYLTAYFRKKNEMVQIRSIGRLDKDTSGVLVFAKNRIAAARLWAQKEQGIFQKEYLAVCEGSFAPEEYETEQTIDMPIGKCRDYPGKMCIDPDGKRAVTHYLAIKGGKVRLRLETGRTHQIRVHMEWAGHPLAGDPLYGNGVRGKTQTALCAYKAEFLQPFSHDRIQVTEDRLKEQL
ncbi:MAG: RluA family pseudouridine synthase [Eubacteriales bacterium]|nr:RluA family pseudouridine synthase [Eubacteriales bacterium]